MPPDRLEQLRAVAEKELRTPNDMLRVIAVTHLDALAQDEGTLPQGLEYLISRLVIFLFRHR